MPADLTFACARGTARCDRRVQRHGTYCSDDCEQVARVMAFVSPPGPVTLGGSANVHQAFDWLDVRKRDREAA